MDIVATAIVLASRMLHLAEEAKHSRTKVSKILHAIQPTKLDMVHLEVNSNACYASGRFIETEIIEGFLHPNIYCSSLVSAPSKLITVVAPVSARHPSSLFASGRRFSALLLQGLVFRKTKSYTLSHLDIARCVCDDKNKAELSALVLVEKSGKTMHTIQQVPTNHCERASACVHQCLSCWKRTSAIVDAHELALVQRFTAKGIDTRIKTSIHQIVVHAVCQDEKANDIV